MLHPSMAGLHFRRFPDFLHAASELPLNVNDFPRRNGRPPPATSLLLGEREGSEPRSRAWSALRCEDGGPEEPEACEGLPCDPFGRKKKRYPGTKHQLTWVCAKRPTHQEESSPFRGLCTSMLGGYPKPESLQPSFFGPQPFLQAPPPPKTIGGGPIVTTAH